MEARPNAAAQKEPAWIGQQFLSGVFKLKIGLAPKRKQNKTHKKTLRVAFVSPASFLPTESIPSGTCARFVPRFSIPPLDPVRPPLPYTPSPCPSRCCYILTFSGILAHTWSYYTYVMSHALPPRQVTSGARFSFEASLTAAPCYPPTSLHC